ncbi:hypothetical protein BC826DRAFT_1102470 [Russula brevipes]|nr:hypothetical protein BC826DRAFT_1102470 [Russula brevipes]
MAKPDFVSPTASPRHSTARPRAKRIARSLSRHTSSSGILAFLATLSASPLSAHAYPLEPPLPFLYPASVIPSTSSLAKRSTVRSTPDAAARNAPRSPPVLCQQERSNLPDKYELGDDGYWHKGPPYDAAYCTVSKAPFLSHSSMSAETLPSLSPQSSCSLPSPVTDTAQTDVDHPPSSSDFDDFDYSSLPTGWRTPSNPTSSRHGTAVVLTLSVALAVTIVMTFACIFWRRRRSPKLDPEKKRHLSSDIPDDGNIREAKAAQRKWCRAANRWRDNIRFSARRRRTNRALAPAASCSTLVEEERQEMVADSGSSVVRSRSSSPTPTQRSVTSTHTHQNVQSSSTPSTGSSFSLHSQSQQIQIPPASTSQTSQPTPPPCSPPSSPLPSQPPAYHLRRSSSPPVPDVSPEYTYSDSHPSGSSKAPLPLFTQSQPPVDESHRTSTSISGHVATDDKAILSRRAALASAPPGSDPHFPLPASVPSMEDEMFELPSGSRPPSPSCDTYGDEPHPPYSPPTFMLPPPPLKGKQRFDYSLDLDIVPSAPPFEESGAVPSAPPLDFDAHVPSAPPMDSDV